jgi:hypothetical protein
MAFGVFIERRKHDGQNNFDIVTDEIAKVLIVPEVESPLGDLEKSAYGVQGLRDGPT